MKQKDLRESPKRAALGKLSGLVGIVCNVGLAGSKLAVGKLAGSMSITADGLNNLSDAASSIVTLTGFKLAEKPADKEHPYGHARFEYLASLTVSVMILFIGFELAKSSVEKVLHPVAVEFSLLSMIVLIASILVKAGMMIFNTRMGKRIDSTVLIATAADSRNDVQTTAAVLAATVVEHISGWKIDGLMGGLVSVFIIVSGISLAKDTISPLLGEGANTGLREQLIGYISSCPLVLGCHDLLVHDYGPGRQYASIHVEIDKKIDPMVCHDEIDRIERECLNRFGVHMVIHYDPVITDDAELDQIHHQVLTILQQIDTEITIHDFRVHTDEGKKELVFDMVVPSEWQGQEKDIVRELTERLQKENKETYLTKITFDIEDRA